MRPVNRSTGAVEDLKMNHWRSKNSKSDVSIGISPLAMWILSMQNYSERKLCMESHFFCAYKHWPENRARNTALTPCERHLRWFSIFWKAFYGSFGLKSRRNLSKWRKNHPASDETKAFLCGSASFANSNRWLVFFMSPYSFLEDLMPQTKQIGWNFQKFFFLVFLGLTKLL